MFERYHSPAGKDDVFRSMLFGASGRRNGNRPQEIPAMEELPEARRQEGPQNPAALPCLEACSLAMVYSPPQEWRGLFPVNEAIRHGTLFSELDKPFLGKTLADR